MKIHIIGCSGTGKTYLAKRLSEKYNIPHFDLDDIFWDNSTIGYGSKRSDEDRDALLGEILKKDDWIIEGVYYSWVQQPFADADIIYVLDAPKYLYKYRIVMRYIKRKLGIEKEKQGTFKSMLDLLRWTDKFQNVNMKEIKVLLEEYSDKVQYIRTRRMDDL